MGDIMVMENVFAKSKGWTFKVEITAEPGLRTMLPSR